MPYEFTDEISCIPIALYRTRVLYHCHESGFSWHELQYGTLCPNSIILVAPNLRVIVAGSMRVSSLVGLLCEDRYG